MARKESKRKTLVIKGVTEDGQTFRPSDWAERVSGKLSTVKNKRVRYSPLLTPSVQEGTQCVLLDESLKDTNPALYQEILDFAKKNKLTICGKEEKDAQ